MRYASGVLMFWLIAGGSVEAQLSSRQSLPREQDLNRYGLTLAWWGQSTLDASSDVVAHLTADERLVYIQSRTGLITAFNAENGQEAWSAFPGRPHQQGYPVVTNDELVLLPIGMRIFAFHKSTGDIAWELELEHHPSTSPEIDERNVYIGSMSGNVVAYDLRRINELYAENSLPEMSFLAELWRYQTPGQIRSAPISDGLVVNIASEARTLYAVSAPLAELRYKVETAGTIITPMGRNHESIFLVAGEKLLCLRQLNGTIRWRFPAGSVVEEPVISIGEHVFLCPIEGGLFCLSANTGLRLWNQPNASAFLAASGDFVYAEDRLGNLLILSRPTGSIVGSLPLRAFEIRIRNDRTDRIYLSTRSGLVICLREEARVYPMFHRFPERQPIVPILAPDEVQDDEDLNG